MAHRMFFLFLLVLFAHFLPSRAALILPQWARQAVGEGTHGGSCDDLLHATKGNFTLAYRYGKQNDVMQQLRQLFYRLPAYSCPNTSIPVDVQWSPSHAPVGVGGRPRGGRPETRPEVDAPGGVWSKLRGRPPSHPSPSPSASPLRLGFLSVRPVPPGLCGYEWEEPSTAGWFDIDPGTHKRYFFWAHPPRSGNSSKTVLWLTGGPGCSSMLALGVENGPCTIQPDGSTVPNPHGWNANATVIWVDQPAGTGYSTSDVTGRDHNEEEVSRDLYRFLQALWTTPSHGSLSVTGSDLTIVAESYGGHYAPALAKVITDANAVLRSGHGAAAALPPWMSPTDVPIPLSAVAIGNGLTVPQVQYQYYPEQGYDYAKKVLGRPVLTQDQVDSMKKAWPTCKSAIEGCQSMDPLCGPAEILCNWAMIGPYQQTGLSPYDMRKKCAQPPLCMDTGGVATFFNAPDVRQALGVPPDAPKWEPCNMLINLDFASDWMKRFDTPYLPPILGNGTRVLVYAGEMDYICNWIGNEAWTLGMEWEGKERFNKAQVVPWKVKGKEAGEARSYGGLTFLRISHAGHMVPSDAPGPALHMLQQVLYDEPFVASG